MNRVFLWLAAVAAFVLVLTISGPGGAARPAAANGVGACGPMDVVFAIDDTGSMGGAINNVKAEAAGLIATINSASGGDFQLGLVSFKDSVEVDEDLAAGNSAAVQAAILGLVADAGAGEPEASDEALNTVVNGLDVADRAPGQQTGDFDGVFRAGATKIVILVTDAHPGGFDDLFVPGVDDVNAHNRALQAAAKGIKIASVFVPTFGDTGQGAIMLDYATTTGGTFVETNADGSGTAGAIQDIVQSCGSASCPGGGIIFPALVVRVIFPGEDSLVLKCVDTPEIPPKADVYFLTDSTGSMDPVIAAVQADAATVIGAIQGSGADVEFGAGDYKDFPPDAFPPSPYAFNNAAVIGPDDGVGGAPDASDAIAAWSASGGGDGPEGQFYALHQLAAHGVASFRPGATPIVVLIGDAPAHDPVCSAISGDAHEISEASLTAELIAAGIKVVAISTITGFPAGLDDDPTGGGDYVAACGAPGGAAGQATRIAAATGGVHLTGVAPADIANAILSAVESVQVEVQMVSLCTIETFGVISSFFTPASQTVTAGDTAGFIETIHVAADAPGGTYTCTDHVLINGSPLIDPNDPDTPIVDEVKIIRVPEGFLTGGGQIVQGKGKNAKKISFGGNIGFLDDGSMTGQWQTNFHNVFGTSLDKAQFHSTEDPKKLQFFQDGGAGPAPPPANANVGRFEVKGRLDGVDGYRLVVCLADRGEPGSSDSIRVQLFSPANVLQYDSLVDFPSQDDTLSLIAGCGRRHRLDGGNFQIHSGVKE